MRATVYCTYRGYYWAADCTLPGIDDYFHSKQHTHGSAKQAADEVLAEIREWHGTDVTMRRISPKTYEITVPNCHEQ